MKKQTLLSGFALALFLTLGFAGSANATTYSSCASVPSSPPAGDVIVNDSGACSLGTVNISGGGKLQVTAASSITASQALTASSISFTAGTSISSQDLTSTSGSIDLNASADSTTTGNLSAADSYIRVQGNNVKVTGTVTATNLGNILLLAQANLQSGSITGAPGYNIDLKANLAGANTLFTIGGTGLTNGVNGTITAKPLGNNPYVASTVLYVTNGTSSSTGGITTTAGALAVTPPAGSRAGYIYVNAQNGVLTIPGTLSANGGTSDGAGVVSLLAKTVAFGANAVVSANQSSGVAGTLHGVVIAAETITYQGTSGLTLSGNGDGADQFSNGYVQVFTKGSVTITDTLDPLNLAINGVLGTVTGNVTFQGTGTAPLLMTADGNNSKIYLFGTKLTFTGGKVTLQSKGATNHSIQISNQNTTAGLVGVAFSGTGAVKLDVEGVSGAGGDIKLYTDKVTLDAPSFTFSANGPTAASGNSGTIIVSTNGTTLKPTSKVTMTANGSSFGTGDSIASDPTGFDPRAITFYPGAVTIDIGTATAAGQYTFQAKGGKNSGHGGTIAISAQGATLKTANAMNASALAGNSDGGEIYFGNDITFEPAATVTAIGKGTGKGGKFTARFQTPANGLNVNKVIKVTGGNTVPTANSHGVIKLNDVRCEQWRTGFASSSFPKTYWNCIDANRATGMPTATAANGLEPGLRNLLGTTLSVDNPSVQVYVMNIDNDYQKFFGRPINNKVGEYGISNLPFRVSVAFANVYNQAGGQVTSESYSGSPSIRQGTIVHELGHQLDYLWGDLSTQAGFTSQRVPDYDSLNSWMNEIPGVPPVVRPCNTVFDATSPFCANHPGLSNSEIFKIEYPVLTSATRDYELFAYVFEHIKSVQPGSGYQVDPWLEAPLRFLPGMTNYIQGLINNPPVAVR